MSNTWWYQVNDGTGWQPCEHYEPFIVEKTLTEIKVREGECEYCGVPLRGDRKCMSCGAPARVERHKDTSIEDAYRFFGGLNG